MTDRKSECEDLQDRVTEYLEQVLGPDESGWFEAHLGRCGDCERQVDQMKAVVHVMHQMGPDPVPREVRERLHALFESWRQTRAGGPGSPG